MSQPKGKTNFRTYEASTRLLAAVIASTNVKLDYNEIAKHVGGGVGVDAINHRFRPIKQLAKMQAECVKKGEDPGELPTDKGEIQKLFGESTPGGIEWQFGGIKRLGKAQQEAVKKGENPATLTIQAPGTPSAGRGRGRPPTTRTPGTGTGRKRKTMANLLPLDSSDENGGADDNDSDFVETPSNRPSKRAATASANKKSGSQSTPTASPANAVTGNPAATMISGLAPISMPRASIFGGGDARAPTTKQSAEPFDDDIKTSGGFNTQCHDWTPRPATKPALIKTEPVVGANSFISSVNSFNSGPYYGEEYDEGEV